MNRGMLLGAAALVVAGIALAARELASLPAETWSATPGCVFEAAREAAFDHDCPRDLVEIVAHAGCSVRLRVCGRVRVYKPTCVLRGSPIVETRIEP